MNFITNSTRGTPGSSSNNAAHHFYQQTGAGEQIELRPLGSEEGPEAHTTEGVISAQNEAFAPPNTVQETEDSNRISLRQELIKASIHRLAIYIRVNTISWLKQKNLSQKKLKHIQERLDEAKSKLIDLDSTNKKIGITTDPKEKIFSEEELERQEELEKLEKLEERLKELVNLKELLSQQLTGLKNSNGNILKILANIEADLKEKDLDEFYKTKWGARFLFLANIIATSIANIQRKNAFYNWIVNIVVNTVAWGINDVFIPVKNMPKRYQTEDLKAIKEEVFSATFLYTLGQKISAEEQRIIDVGQEISNLERRIEEMEAKNIVQIRQTTDNLAKTLADRDAEIKGLSVQYKTEFEELKAQHEADSVQHKAEFEELKVQHKAEFEELKVQHKKELDKLRDDIKGIIKEEIEKNKAVAYGT